MIRIALVVSAFFVANTAGFIAYRSASRTVVPRRTLPASEATMSPPAIQIQRKPSEMSTPTPAPAAPSDVANSAVSKPTNQKSSVTSAKPMVRQGVRVTTKKLAPEVTATKPVEKNVEKNTVLDMDENPYKRGE
ncbi:MAG TPA: hypothetical protein VGM39_19785 [Kofleriaceae bacterium]|jgi:hypothetical protein